MRWFAGLFILPLTGCSLFAPEVLQSPPEKMLAAARAADGCFSSLETPATIRACALQKEIEGRRKTHETVPGVVTSILIPAAGVVAYQSTAGHSSSSTGAIAATGLALYALTGALAPATRIEAYSRGSRALSCALGEYGLAIASANAEGQPRSDYEQALKAARKAASGDKDVLQEIADIERLVSAKTLTGLVDAQLSKFVSLTVEDLNGLLRGTLPTLAGLGQQVAALSNANGGDGVRSDTQAFSISSTATSNLVTKAEALIAAEAGTRPSVDLTPCLMSTAALSAQGLYTPMTLGPGNSMNGAAIDASQLPIDIAVTGGQMPYAPVVTGEPAIGRPKAEISMPGVALLKISPGGSPDKEATYTIAVWDSIGSKRSLTVKFPAPTAPPQPQKPTPVQIPQPQKPDTTNPP
jgi:hypothetical protein